MRQIVGMLILALTVGACARSPLPPDATGEQIYETLCVRCHGVDLGGGLGPALGPGSEAATMKDEFYRVTIEHGLGRMPAFGATLRDDQVEQVIEFIREQQGSR